MQLLFFVMRYFYGMQDDGWQQKTLARTQRERERVMGFWIKFIATIIFINIIPTIASKVETQQKEKSSITFN